MPVQAHLRINDVPMKLSFELHCRICKTNIWWGICFVLWLTRSLARSLAALLCVERGFAFILHDGSFRSISLQMWLIYRFMQLLRRPLCRSCVLNISSCCMNTCLIDFIILHIFKNISLVEWMCLKILVHFSIHRRIYLLLFNWRHACSKGAQNFR